MGVRYSCRSNNLIDHTINHNIIDAAINASLQEAPLPFGWEKVCF